MQKRQIYLREAQTALEFMLLLAIVAAIVLVGFKLYIPKSRNAAEGYYNVVAVEIMGPSPSINKTR